jgi:co-chaperonin GroES (HSP10)
MTYKVLGPRILLKVVKFNSEAQTFKGSAILMPQLMQDQETISQTLGEVLQIGPTVKSKYEGFEDLKVGDQVHFSRYGAMRIGIDDNRDIETWIIDGKDILCIKENNITEVTNV